MTDVSVAVIAETPAEIQAWLMNFPDQTMEHEIVTSTAETIPAAWNDCINKANGDIILFTESDVQVTSTWVEEMVTLYNSREADVLLGHEIRLPDHTQSMSNVAVRKTLCNWFPFNEDMGLTEDTEWFARLMEDGYRVEKCLDAPVVHHYKNPPTPLRSFRHGVHRAEIWLHHGYEGKTAAGVTSRRLNRMLCEAATLLGQVVGVLKHPVKTWRKLR